MNKYTQCDVTFLMVASIESYEVLCESIETIAENTEASIVLVLDPIKKSDHEISQVINLENTTKNLKIILAQYQNQGLTKSLNQGLKHVKTAITSRTDPGDFSSGDRLQVTLNVFNNSDDVILCGCKAILYSSDGRLIYYPRDDGDSYVTREQLASGNPLAHGSISFRTQSILEIGGYDEFFRYSQDYELYERITKLHGGQSILKISKSFYSRTINTTAVSYVFADEQTKYSLEINKRINSDAVIDQEKITKKSLKKKMFALGANGKYKDLIEYAIQNSCFFLGVGYVLKMIAVRNFSIGRKIFY